MTERIEKINMDWFLMEPALFKVLCSHQVVANTDMRCPLRSGGRRIEYNPALCKEVSDDALHELFKAECIRILLKHPYTRQPEGCCAEAITRGSNCVVSDNYKMKYIELDAPRDFGLEKGMHFEYYAKAIQEMMQSNDNDNDSLRYDNDDGQQSQEQGDSNGNGQQSQQDSSESDGQQDANGEGQQSQQNSSGGKSQQGDSDDADSSSAGRQEGSQNDASALWKEDPMTAAEVNEMIKVMEASNNWGSLAGSLVGQIIASTKVKIDYRKVMQSFRAEVLSSKRHLTRMRPNRRSGFENFGSVYSLTSRLLVAVDVSGSTTDEMVSNFFGIINKFFKYGIEEIDVIQFDADIKGEPMTLKKAKRGGISITGRCGTCFQPVIDYCAQKKHYYQGLIILTDGYASEPTLPDYFNTPVLWVLPSESEYEVHKDWMLKSGKACFIK